MTAASPLSEQIMAGDEDLRAVLTVDDNELWGVGWAWAEETDRIAVEPGGRDRVYYGVRARLFAPTVDVGETLRGYLDQDGLRGTLECVAFEDGRPAGNLVFEAEFIEAPRLHFPEPLMELEFMGIGGEELHDYLDRVSSR